MLMQNQSKQRKCNCCTEVLPIESFGKSGRFYKNGEPKYLGECKQCRNIKNAQWRLNNPDKIKPKDHEKQLQYALNWRQKNREKDRLKAGLYHQRFKQCTPHWADMDKIKEIYKEAHEKRLSVDHIIPIKHNRVCGLHVHWNLQLLTKSENCSKGNKF